MTAPSARGYNGNVLHVDLERAQSRAETPPESFYRTYVGGGLLGTHYLLTQTPPHLDAFDPRNLLIFASSVIAGQLGPGLARFSVITKSPQSGGVCEGRSEGPWGVALKASGFDALVLGGRAERPVYLLVEGGAARLLPAEDLWGKDVGATTSALMDRHGSDCHVAAIGPAGERRVRFATIVTEGVYQTLRGGAGAVMGSKHLKAVVLRGGVAPEPADPAALRTLAHDYEQGIPANPLSRWQKASPGWATGASFDMLPYMQNQDVQTPGYVSIRNFQTCSVKHLEALGADQFMPFLRRDGGGCPGCPGDCAKGFAGTLGAPGPAYVLEQEVPSALGTNLGVTDAATILRGHAVCAELGIDPVAAGAVLGFVMECRERGGFAVSDLDGVDFRFGRGDAVPEMLERIAYRRGAGDWLAEGVKHAASRVDPSFRAAALHVKGIELPQVEPRFQAGIALGYALSPVGPRFDFCEHDWDFDTITGWTHSLNHAAAIGLAERIPMEEFSARKVREFRALSTLWSACDALNLCIFASAPTRVFSVGQIVKLVAVITGWETSAEELMQWGERRLQLMRVYNVREGLSAADDGLPERFFRDPIDVGRFKGLLLDPDTFRSCVLDYYASMGWDTHGVPRADVLREHGLEMEVL